MKKIKFFVLLFMLIPIVATANTNLLSITSENKNWKLFIERTTKQYSKLFSFDTLDIVLVNVENEFYLFGKSNANKKNCKVTLYLNENRIKNKPFVIFVLLQEIAHCKIGRDVLYRKNKSWFINIDENTKKSIQEHINRQTQLLIEKKIGTHQHPNIIWHDIAADLIAFMWIAEKTKNINKLTQISNKLDQNYSHSFSGRKTLIIKIKNEQPFHIMEIIDTNFKHIMLNDIDRWPILKQETNMG